MRHFSKKVTKEHIPGVLRTWGRIHTFCSHLKIRLKRNLDKSMLEALFLKNNKKIAAAVGKE